ncbi:MAG: hypothetical protein JST00_13400 [Deltaproteobacteria bacterium]|nr:hypothetical protein [Deltaproteobacteria bacterium]
MPAAMGDELLHAPARSKDGVPRLDAVRGFVFLSGLRWIERRGLALRFEELLPPRLRELVTSLTTSDWVPLDDALEVYDALDRLGLEMEEQIELGRAVSQANNGIIVSTVSRLLGTLGTSPWTAFGHYNRVWQRSNRGGCIAVYRVAARVARLEFWRVPLARSPFFVTSMRGAVAIGLEPFCDKLVTSDVPELASDEGFAIRMAW